MMSLRVCLRIFCLMLTTSALMSNISSDEEAYKVFKSKGYIDVYETFVKMRQKAIEILRKLENPNVWENQKKEYKLVFDSEEDEERSKNSFIDRIQSFIKTLNPVIRGELKFDASSIEFDKLHETDSKGLAAGTSHQTVQSSSG